MQTNTNEFVPQQHDPHISPQQGGFPLGKVLLGVAAGILFGALAMSLVFLLGVFETGPTEEALASSDLEEMKELVVSELEDRYQPIVESFSARINAADLTALSTERSEGVHTVLFTVSLSDSDLADDLEQSVRAGFMPASTTIDDYMVGITEVRFERSGDEWELIDISRSYVGLGVDILVASLQKARDRGADAAIKSDLNNFRALAELYYDDNDRSYAGLERSTETREGLERIAEHTPGVARCESDDDAYICYAELVKESERGQTLYYCIDSTMYAGETENNPSFARDLRCQPAL